MPPSKRPRRAPASRRLGGDDLPPPCDSDDEDAPVVVQERDRVYFYAEVSRSTVLQLLQSLHKATEYALKHCESVHDAAVYLYVHSSGGDAFAGLSAFDHIRSNRVPVTTVIDGFVASAATFLVLGGQHRAAMRHSALLIHQLSLSNFWGKFSDLVDEVHNSTSLMDTIKSVYAEHTHLTKKKLDAMLSKEKNMDAQTCLELGFVHELW